MRVTRQHIPRIALWAARRGEEVEQERRIRQEWQKHFPIARMQRLVKTFSDSANARTAKRTGWKAEPLAVYGVPLIASSARRRHKCHY
jgi:hypothetical protein